MASVSDAGVSSAHLFRGSEYIVTLENQAGAVLVEVEDKLSADQWRATFDSAYIEDLTHKTGNFKQFNVFVSMLESAISQTSDSVSLDLLTYADLESLRQRKSGSTIKSSIPAPRATVLNSKRYLILTYTVEFDRIHYPLPLPYVGKPDPRQLQEIIRKLKGEIKVMRHQGISETKMRENERLHKENSRLQRDKEALEADFLQYRRELKSTSAGSAANDVRMLKTLVKNLEEDLMKEKSKHQRLASKRGQEYRELLEEVEELRASERNLRVRVKSLTNELALYKRDRARGTQRTSRPSTRERSSSYDRYTRERSLSNDRSYSRDRTYSQDRLFGRPRSSSRERPSTAPNRSSLSDRSPSTRKSFVHTRSRTPSPSGARNPRFDPTAYIKEKERLKRESHLKKKRQTSANISRTSNRSTGPSPGRTNTSRLSAQSRNRSRNSSLGSQGDLSDGGMSDSSYRGLRNYNNNSKQKRASFQTSPGVPRKETRRAPVNPKKKIYPFTPDSDCGRKRTVRNKENYPDSDNESEYFDRSAEICDIDERLNRLQQLMKASLS
ncbi:centrosomal protein CCDC61-like isoform X2 [Haliotis asinina]|uniref:centrosomal protein CCDC61-like isoform X2 n=1 Tax=Haliotis asinina TaxID=109174 RepID=UPI0035322312